MLFPWTKKKQEDRGQPPPGLVLHVNRPDPTDLVNPDYRNPNRIATRARTTPKPHPRDACRWCDVPRDDHGTRYMWLVGYHTWSAPDSCIRKPIREH